MDDPGDLIAPSLVAAFDGWVDSGSAATTALGTLVPDARVVARFEADRLFDYRARRPTLDSGAASIVGVDIVGVSL